MWTSTTPFVAAGRRLARRHTCVVSSKAGFDLHVTATVLRIDRAQSSCVPACTVVDHEKARRKRFRPANPGPPACAPGRIRTCATASGGRFKTRWLTLAGANSVGNVGLAALVALVTLVVYGFIVAPLLPRQDQQRARRADPGGTDIAASVDNCVLVDRVALRGPAQRSRAVCLAVSPDCNRVL